MAEAGTEVNRYVVVWVTSKEHSWLTIRDTVTLKTTATVSIRGNRDEAQRLANAMGRALNDSVVDSDQQD